jgi:photosystem II stability/assembly factor-like uncharacterized protein
LKTPPVTLNGIAFDRELGIIVGNRGLILRSDDAGGNWQQVRAGLSREGYGDGPPQ